jgi:alanine dehydrogenase
MDPGSSRSGVLGIHATDGGFHAKAAILNDSASGNSWFVVKLNANFPNNPAANALPTIQGVLVLFDAKVGTPLAVMDSMSVTIIRTAAATAVAARYLSKPDASSMTIIGCGAQALTQIAAVREIRPIDLVQTVDNEASRAEKLASSVEGTLGIRATASASLADATRSSDIVVTCTPSKRAFLRAEHLRPGTFVAAVGADNEDKSEIAPELMAASAVVVDNLHQCETIGDLHHAITAGAMKRSDVKADLGALVANPKLACYDPSGITLFDSTGVAIEDVAAAVVVYDRALEKKIGLEFDFVA